MADQHFPSKPKVAWLREVRGLCDKARSIVTRNDSTANVVVRGDDAAEVARHVATQTLDMAAQARAAGLSTLAYLLEMAAVEAAAGPWPGRPEE